MDRRRRVRRFPAQRNPYELKVPVCADCGSVTKLERGQQCGIGSTWGGCRRLLCDRHLFQPIHGPNAFFCAQCIGDAEASA